MITWNSLKCAFLRNYSLFYKVLCVWLLIIALENRNVLYAVFGYILYCVIDAWEIQKRKGE